MRFILDLAQWQAPWADVHILYRWGTDGFWDTAQVATLHRKDTDQSALSFINRLRPDIIHHHFPWGQFLVKQLLESGFPLIGTAHGWTYGCDPVTDQGFWVHPVGGPLPTKIRLGVDCQAYPIKTHHPNKEIVVGLVGRRSPEKIPDKFLDELEKGIPEGIVLRFIGSGLKTDNHNKITKRLLQLPVEIVGDIPQNDMPKAYNELDAIIIPSSRESASYVAIEAMACGLPVVGRLVEGLPDTVEGVGLLGATDAEMIQHLGTLRDNPELRAELGRRGRKRAEQHFTLDRMLREYNEVYARATNGIVRAPEPSLDCSVVIPVYNTPSSWLRESLDSVINQEGRFEIVLVDDASTKPETIKTLNWYARTYPDLIRLFRSGKNEGIGMALNHGIRLARADLIIRFDSDDVCLPGRIKTQINYMQDHPEVDLVSGQMEFMDSGKATATVYDSSKPIWAQPKNVNPILHPTVAMRRASVIRVGWYSTDRMCQDLDLWCTMQRAGCRLVVTQDLLIKYRRVNWGEKVKERMIYDRRVRQRYASTS